MTQSRQLFVVLAALLAVGCSSSASIREPAELVDIVEGTGKPEVLWNSSAGNGSGDTRTGLRLSVHSDGIFSADVKGRVYAFNPVNGKRLWRVDTDARVVSGPTVDGDLVLVGTLDAEVIALRRADGVEQWRSKVSSEVLAAPAIGGDTIVVRCVDGRLFGLSPSTGLRRWSFDRAVPQLTLRGLSQPVIYGGLVLVGQDNGRVVALRLEDGQAVWEQAVAAPSGRSELERIVDVDADLLLAGDGLFAVSFGGELAAVGVEEGRVAWRRPVKSYSGMAFDGRLVAVSDDEGQVWGLDGQSGAAAWKQEALRYRQLSPPTRHGSYFVVSDFEGYVHWLSANDGTVRARTRALRAPVHAPGVEMDGVLYLQDVEGRIVALALPG